MRMKSHTLIVTYLILLFHLLLDVLLLLFFAQHLQVFKVGLELLEVSLLLCLRLFVVLNCLVELVIQCCDLKVLEEDGLGGFL